MNAQHAPAALRHSCEVAEVKSACRKAHSTSAGTAISSSQATSTVARMLRGEENSRSLSQGHTPTWLLGGGRPSLGICVVVLMSTLHQRDALVVPVHEDRYGQTDRQVGRHDDENALDGLPGLVHGDRKSTRLNSSHVKISYAVFCLKKKKRETPACG